MKNFKIWSAALAFLLVFTTSCEKSNDTPDTDALELPPYETMAIDFGDFGDDSASGKQQNLQAYDKAPNGNWVYSRLVVGVWNTALFTSLAVPVASFKAAFAHEAEFLGDETWQWTYTVDGFSSEYTARLTGQLVGDGVEWNMYITKAGVNPFEEFLWFSGESDLSGNSGNWILNQSPERPNAMLRIDWERSNEEVASIRYTWVRELNENEETDTFRDSYLQYGLQEGDLDAYFDAHVFDINMEDFVDVRIEWSRTDFNGRVRAPHVYEDEEWHCWDNTGEDVLCE